jgi:hypothetical protein
VKKAFAVLTALFALALFGPSAAAAGSTGATTSADGRMTFVAPSGAPRTDALKAFGVEGRDKIYSTFNNVGDPYDCCGGWTISTRDSVLGSRQFIAMPFTPADSGSVGKIKVAVGWVTGANAANISLRSDVGGVPGEILTRFTPSDLQVFGTCCDVTTLRVKGVAVTAGTPYWVVVRASADTWAAWNFNTVGLSGSFAVKPAEGPWQLTSGTLSAFSVLSE